MSFNITLTGWKEFNETVDPKRRKELLLKTMRQVTLMIAAYVKSEELSGQVLNIRTGRLKASIQGLARIEGNAIVGQVGTNVKYARIHELGGTIHAKNSPYLKFKVGGRWVQKKEVRIPARPFLVPALKKNEAKVVGMFQKTIDDNLGGK